MTRQQKIATAPDLQSVTVAIFKTPELA